LDTLESTSPDAALRSTSIGSKSAANPNEHQSLLNAHKDAVELLSRTVAVGPKNQGPNLLLLSPDALVSVWSENVPNKAAGAVSAAGDGDSEVDASGAVSSELSTVSLRTQRSLFLHVWSRIASAVAAGFQVVAAAGPLMQEPLHGVGFAVEKIEISRSALSGSLTSADLDLLGISQTTGEAAISSSMTSSASSTDGSSSGGGGGLMIGQLISDVKDALRLAVVSCPVRIVEPVYACDLQCDQSQLGNLYAVLSKRRGQVHKEDIIEGTSLFLLSASLPVAESFGFAQELLKRTSGNGTAPQLRFSHWQVQEEDPFWRPTTAEELEDHGELAAEPNNARACIDKVRKRKGLQVEEKIVVFAEKQRTLNKKK
jgi:ribosome assembly protein 1